MKATIILVVVPVLVISVLIVGAFNGFRFGDGASLPVALNEVLAHPDVQISVEENEGRLVIVARTDDAELQKQLAAAGLQLKALRLQIEK